MKYLLPTAPLFSVAAQSAGIMPGHPFILMAAVFGLIVLALKFAKGHSLTFAFETASGIASHRQANAMKDYIPAPVRERIEAGRFDLNIRTEMPMAIVGMVDIAHAARISERIGSRHDFDLKTAFLKAAHARAKQFRISILNPNGESFLFVADRAQDPQWRRNIILFYLGLTSDFKMIVHKSNSVTRKQIEGGLRFGVSAGPLTLGCLGSNPAHYTAVGAEVNVVAGLCAKADSNEIVFSEKAWLEFKGILKGLSKKFAVHEFDGSAERIVGIHVSRTEFLARPAN